MGILDDAIREHLDLKRKHGARDAELKSLEDEAFGGGERPDPFAAGELFGDVAAPPAEGETGSGELPGPATPPPGPPGASEEPTRIVEAPEAEPPPPPEPPSAQAPAPVEAPPELEPDAGPEPPPAPEPSSPSPPDDSASLEELMAEEDSTEMAVPPPPPPPDTAEAARPGGEAAAPPPPSEPEAELPPRELVGEPDAGEDDDAEAEAPAAEAEIEAVEVEEVEVEAEAEPEDVPPPPPPPESGPEPPGRARGRVNVPTQEFTPPPAGTDERDALDDALVEASEDSPPAESSTEGPDSEVYDFATDEEPFGGDSDDFEVLGPVTDEAAAEEGDDFESEGYTDEHTAERGVVRDPDDTGDFDPSTMVRDPDESDEFPAALPETGDHDEVENEGDDILAGSPDFVEEGEDDDLWFEKGPPKDFDFEDEEK